MTPEQQLYTHPAAMEPLMPESSRGRLADLSCEILRRAGSLSAQLPSTVVRTRAATLVQEMNSYYSNLIEGHYTHPIDIERALNNDYSQDNRKRDLQLEARAHIVVQKWLDNGALAGSNALSAEGICEIHRRFCELLPADLLWVEEPITKERIPVVPGELRGRLWDRLP